MSLLWSRVRRRAAESCEYCRLPQTASEFTFPVDHIIARQHGGATEADNLALACPHCNSSKGPNIAGFDPFDGKLTRLYHPRRDVWIDHFSWSGALALGLTAVGRTTVGVLAMNTFEMIALRESLIDEGWEPSP